MRNALAAELLLMRRRKVAKVLAAVWCLLVAAFAYGIPFIVQLSLPEKERQALLELISTPSFAATSLSSYPLFGAAIMLVLGAIIGGSEWGWDRWKVRFVQGPTRWNDVLAKFGVVALTAAVIALVAQAVALGVSMALSASADVSTALPPITRVLGSVAVAMLISVVLACVGLALSILLRGTSMALIVGLLWVLAFESVISGLVLLWKPLAPLQKVLLGPASGSLAAEFGAKPLSEGGTPGVVAASSPAVAVAILIVYLVVAVAASGIVMSRRDIN